MGWMEKRSNKALLLLAVSSEVIIVPRICPALARLSKFILPPPFTWTPDLGGTGGLSSRKVVFYSWGEAEEATI